jgi:hypothetical protein
MNRELLIKKLKEKSVPTHEIMEILSKNDHKTIDQLLSKHGKKSTSKRGKRSSLKYRPKSKKSCNKRKMAWNSSTKRCNKKYYGLSKSGAAL